MEPYNLCREFLEENEEDWEKNKRKRQEEKIQIDRLQMAKSKRRKAQINHVKKKIEDGMKRLPMEERKRLEGEEKKKERLEIQRAKTELWKLRRKKRNSSKTKSKNHLKKPKNDIKT